MVRDCAAAATVATEFVTPAITTGGDGTPYGPYYAPMIPFNPHIKEAFAGGKRDGFFVLRADEAVVFRQSGVTVIDLSKLR